MTAIGFIYKITNMMNGKVYIGQTVKTVEERFREHKSDSLTKEVAHDYPLYRAFRKYGFNNFELEMIEKCSVDELDDREIYWISYFDSYHNGYNQTLGGGGKRLLELNEEEVVNKYRELETVSEVARYFDCCNYTIRNILNKHNVEIKSSSELAKEQAYAIIQYDLEGNELNKFRSQTEAGQWLIDNGFSKAKTAHNAGKAVFLSLLKDKNKAFGFQWAFENDPYTEEFKKNYREKDKEIHRRSSAKNYTNQKNVCPICGKEKLKDSKVCDSCERAKRKDNAIKSLEEEKGINREVLKSEIRLMSFVQLGKKYNVSDNAIRKWCKKFNLPCKASEIKAYTEEEWMNI